MTTKQRIFIMADLWPAAAAAQDWPANNRALRLRVFSLAVSFEFRSVLEFRAAVADESLMLPRELKSAGELDHRRDLDALIRALRMLAEIVRPDNFQAGEDRRRRAVLADELKCLALYVGDAAAYVGEILRTRFGGALAEELSGARLDQLLYTVSARLNDLRRQAGDTGHAMRARAGARCRCAQCRTSPRRERRPAAAPVTVGDCPF